MTLAPLLNASSAVQLHAFSAFAAFTLGMIQLSAPKGTLPHRIMGYLWVVLMLGVAGSGLWIHETEYGGQWSFVLLISVYTLAVLPLGVWRARKHNVGAHRSTMIALFTGALVVAGLLTLLPDRIMHAVVFGS